MNEAVLLSALAIVSLAVGALIWIIKFMFEKMIPLIESNIAVTSSADKYLRERNGRDMEHHTAVLNAINAIPTALETIAADQSKAILKAVGVAEKKDQHVTNQVVDTQIIKESK